MSATNENSRRTRRFASARQRLKTPGRRGVEFRPIKLLLQAAKGFVTDLALRTQAVQRLALSGDRTQPQLVIPGRSLRCLLALRDLAGGRKLLAHRCCGARRVAVETVERRVYSRAST